MLWRSKIADYLDYMEAEHIEGMIFGDYKLTMKHFTDGLFYMLSKRVSNGYSPVVISRDRDDFLKEVNNELG